MAKRGKMKYLPANVLKELEDIKLSEGLFSDSEALNKMARYSSFGREADRITSLDFFGKRKKNKKDIL